MKQVKQSARKPKTVELKALDAKSYERHAGADRLAESPAYIPTLPEAAAAFRMCAGSPTSAPVDLREFDVPPDARQFPQTTAERKIDEIHAGQLVVLAHFERLLRQKEELSEGFLILQATLLRERKVAVEKGLEHAHTVRELSGLRVERAVHRKILQRLVWGNTHSQVGAFEELKALVPRL